MSMKGVAPSSACGEKSHVGMILCCICMEPMEILFDRRLRDSLCKNNIVPGRVCDKCEKEYLSKGILVMNPESGSIAVIKDSALRMILNDGPGSDALYNEAVAKRRCFADERVVSMLINAGNAASQMSDEITEEV